MELSESLVFQVLQSEEEFPIDFDNAWPWIGYSRKSDAKEVLEARFDKGSDFCGEIRKNGSRGRPVEKIFLTVECFKSFCMMADTDQGKQVRRYFLDCEKELKRRIAEDRQRHKQRVVKAIVSEEHARWQKRFEDQFFEEAYRVTGQDKSPSGHPPWMGGFIKENVYGYFPDGSIDELEKVNPKVDGRRKRKHHQHLQPLGLNVLDSHKMAVIAIMRLSPDNNSNRFKQNLQKALGNAIQLELPFLDETE